MALFKCGGGDRDGDAKTRTSMCLVFVFIFVSPTAATMIDSDHAHFVFATDGLFLRCPARSLDVYVFEEGEQQLKVEEKNNRGLREAMHVYIRAWTGPDRAVCLLLRRADRFCCLLLCLVFLCAGVPINSCLLFLKRASHGRPQFIIVRR